MKTKAMVLVVVLMWMGIGGMAAAVDWTWVGGASQSWSESGNWQDSGGNPGIPGTGDSVYIHQDALGGSFTVLFDAGTDPLLEYLKIDAVDEFSTGMAVQQDDFSLTSNHMDVGMYNYGYYYQNGGSLTANDNLALGAWATGTGEYHLNDGSVWVGVNETIGSEGTGYFYQNGGMHSVAGTLYMGGLSGYGRYEMNAGDLYAEEEYVGLVGTGEFVQWGGTHTANGILALGYFDTSSGNYEMYGGSLTVHGNEIIGVAGGAGFYQGSETTHYVGGDLILGDQADGSGLFTLDAGPGSLEVAGNEYVGRAGYGEFVQYLGDHLIHGDLYVDMAVASKGVFHLYDGTLTVEGSEYVGTNENAVGEFNQYGGVQSVANDLMLATNPASTGYYNVHGGDLAVGGNFVIGNQGYGQMSQTQDAAVSQITVGNEVVIGDNSGSSGYYYLYDGSLQTVWETIGKSEGSYGEFNQHGGTHLVGQSLTLGLDSGSTGNYYHWNGDLGITDALNVGGEGSGKFVQDGGTVSCGYGPILGGGATGYGEYYLQNGTLNSVYDESGYGNEAFVGEAGTGYFYQTGGLWDATGTAIYLGDTGYGRYELTNGDLIAGGLALGEWGGTGEMIQNGGSGVTSNFELARQCLPVRSTGYYEMNDGSMLVQGNMTVGGLGDGTVLQTGGMVQVEQGLRVGGGYDSVQDNRGAGLYTLAGGDLLTGYTVVGQAGIGTMIQDGGNHTITDDLNMGAELGSSGTYELRSGILQVGRFEHLAVDGGTANFVQSGGTHTTGGYQVLASGTSSATASYVLSGESTLGVGTWQAVGWVGSATFELNGPASHTVGTNLYVGSETGGRGHYTMNGGTLTVNGNETVGRHVDSEGIFDQMDGEHTVGGTLYVARDPGSTGTFNLNGGTLTVGNLINNGQFNYNGGLLSSAGIENNGTFKTTDVSVEFGGTFTNNGAYISDPSTQSFENLLVTENGYLQGGGDDTFIIRNNFENHSTAGTLWDTDESRLEFVYGDDMNHDVYLAGADLGAILEGYENNFAWGVLFVGKNIITLLDGNATAGGAFYAKEVGGVDITGGIVNNIIGQSGLNVYYLSLLPENGYLMGLTYDLTDGGQLIPIIPEPATLSLLLVGAMGLVWKRRVGKH